MIAKNKDMVQKGGVGIRFGGKERYILMAHKVLRKSISFRLEDVQENTCLVMGTPFVSCDLYSSLNTASAQIETYYTDGFADTRLNRLELEVRIGRGIGGERDLKAIRKILTSNHLLRSFISLGDITNELIIERFREYRELIERAAEIQRVKQLIRSSLEGDRSIELVRKHFIPLKSESERASSIIESEIAQEYPRGVSKIVLINEGETSCRVGVYGGNWGRA
jgi:hypothetical protein